jgi:hypothetical protein
MKTSWKIIRSFDIDRNVEHSVDLFEKNDDFSSDEQVNKIVGTFLRKDRHCDG